MGGYAAHAAQKAHNCQHSARRTARRRIWRKKSRFLKCCEKMTQKSRFFRQCLRRARRAQKKKKKNTARLRRARRAKSTQLSALCAEHCAAQNLAKKITIFEMLRKNGPKSRFFRQCLRRARRAQKKHSTATPRKKHTIVSTLRGALRGAEIGEKSRFLKFCKKMPQKSRFFRQCLRRALRAQKKQKKQHGYAAHAAQKAHNCQHC